MKTIQDGYIAKSKPLTEKEWNKRSVIRKTLQNIARLADSLL